MPILIQPRDALEVARSAEETTRPELVIANANIESRVGTEIDHDASIVAAESIARVRADSPRIGAPGGMCRRAQETSAQISQAEGGPAAIVGAVDAVEGDDHLTGLRLRESPEVTLHADAVRGQRISKRNVGSRTAITSEHEQHFMSASRGS